MPNFAKHRISLIPSSPDWSHTQVMENMQDITDNLTAPRLQEDGLLTTETEDTCALDTSELSAAISIAIESAVRFMESVDLGGYDAVNAYDSIIATLERGLAEVRAVRGHKHMWNINDYCSICGADGRA